jgi:4,5-DOPA dioxygenase extradiol
MTSQKPPTVFVSHGSPMTALDAGPYAQALAAFGKSVAPAAILVISAHWQEPGIRIASGIRPDLIYDFGGFPRELYELKYPAPGLPDLAAEADHALRVSGFEASLDEGRGWDHGVWVPLRLMFPEARIPVLQVSLPVQWSARELYRVGAVLNEFRKNGVLVLGSGGLVHNLRMMNWASKDAPAEKWALEFQRWIQGAIERHDLESLFNYEKLAPHSARAVPTAEHFAPLFTVLGAAEGYANVKPIFDGIEHGNMSMFTFALQ